MDKPLSIYQVLSKSPHKKSKDDFENLFNCNMKKFWMFQIQTFS